MSSSTGRHPRLEGSMLEDDGLMMRVLEYLEDWAHTRVSKDFRRTYLQIHHPSEDALAMAVDLGTMQCVADFLDARQSGPGSSVHGTPSPGLLAHAVHHAKRDIACLLKERGADEHHVLVAIAAASVGDVAALRDAVPIMPPRDAFHTKSLDYIASAALASPRPIDTMAAVIECGFPVHVPQTAGVAALDAHNMDAYRAVLMTRTPGVEHPVDTVQAAVARGFQLRSALCSMAFAVGSGSLPLCEWLAQHTRMTKFPKGCVPGSGLVEKSAMCSGAMFACIADAADAAGVSWSCSEALERALRTKNFAVAKQLVRWRNMSPAMWTVAMQTGDTSVLSFLHELDPMPAHVAQEALCRYCASFVLSHEATMLWLVAHGGTLNEHMILSLREGAAESAMRRRNGPRNAAHLTHAALPDWLAAIVVRCIGATQVSEEDRIAAARHACKTNDMGLLALCGEVTFTGEESADDRRIATLATQDGPHMLLIPATRKTHADAANRNISARMPELSAEYPGWDGLYTAHYRRWYAATVEGGGNSGL
ncbi:hypothetical protein JKP88DRAFT_352677 [Tribonema minus]|uniref:Ankyrin repeat protein n=1 Tax=Tribonema minus TaxID=303371 RepID=A0A836CL35_9STRA|nr:hypothetical protein JKP88DRAFT_352677 [Tribonema minus]